MKKISKRIASFAVALALVVVLGLTLTACGNSNSYAELTLEQYQANLEKAGYEHYETKPGDEYWSNYKTFYIEMIGDTDAVKAAFDKAEWMLRAEKGESEENSVEVYIMKFSDHDSANVVYDAFKNSINQSMEESTNEQEKAEMRECKLVVAGNVAIFAQTQDALNAAYAK